MKVILATFLLTLYLVHVKDAEADFYVLFRVEEIEQGEHCTITWAKIPAPRE